MADPEAEPPLVDLPDALVDPEAVREPSLFVRIGGRRAVEAVIDRLYAAIEADPDLRFLFPADLTPGRLRQQWFLEEWLGGERRFTARRGSPRLGQRHQPFAITRPAATRWLGHMQRALDDAAVETADVQAIMGGLRPLAAHFVRAQGPEPERDALPP